MIHLLKTLGFELQTRLSGEPCQKPQLPFTRAGFLSRRLYFSLCFLIQTTDPRVQEDVCVCLFTGRPGSVWLRSTVVTCLPRHA